jgi:hypothetical protein
MYSPKAMMQISRNSPTNSTATTVGLFIGQLSFPWRTQKASKLDPPSLLEMGAEVTFAGTEPRVCYVVPVHKNGLLKRKASLQAW